MGSKRNDPWAPLPGFEPYEPKLTDGFDSVVDTRASDLASYLRAEAKKLRQSRPNEPITTVVLPDGTHGQLIEKADSYEVVVHLRRDIYRVFSARSRAGALEAANKFHTSGTKITQQG